VGTKFESEAPDSRISVDEEAMRGALINLIMNSAEAMPEGGEIRLAVRVIGRATVEIQVADDGPGIPSDLADRIFDPFVTTKPRGNGFGLPLAMRAAEANGGHLRLLETGERSGAHFVFEIPIYERGAST
jgi:signal transduction histidine kinase